MNGRAYNIFLCFGDADVTHPRSVCILCQHNGYSTCSLGSHDKSLGNIGGF